MLKRLTWPAVTLLVAGCLNVPSTLEGMAIEQRDRIAEQCVKDVRFAEFRNWARYGDPADLAIACRRYADDLVGL